MLDGWIGKKSDGLRLQGSTHRFREIVKVLRQRNLLQGISPMKVRQILEDLGPTFVKLGQIMSMRPDFLPQEYCDELARLQMNVKPVPFSVVKEVIEAEYGCRWDQVFRSIDEEVLGSASIAQVHRAVLLSGARVVIKVQRPNIYEVMAKDIVLLKRAAALLKVVSDTSDVIDFGMLLDEMWAIAKQEMDFLLEASHMDEFRHLNADDPRVECPNVYHKLTTSHILVMEYIDGIRFDDCEALEALGFDMEQLGQRLGENYVRQIVENGYFHADPHPGNIWLRKGKIVWLDLGMMGRLSARDRSALRKAVAALTNHDILEMKTALLSLGTPRGCIDHTRLYEDIKSLMEQYRELDFGTLEMGTLTRQIMHLLRIHRIGIGAGLSMFVRGVLTMEGVMRCCCPRIRLVEIFARSLEGKVQNEFDWRAGLDGFKREGYLLLKRTMLLPEQISDILRMTMSGQTKVNLDLTGSEEPLRRMDRMMNKLIIGMISSALLLGSSILCTTQMSPRIMEMPLLGVFGYLAALILCGRLLWDIIRGH